MKLGRSNIMIAALLMQVSLGILLASPFNAFCQQTPVVEVVVSGGCCCPASTPADETAPSGNGCCPSGACCSSCNVPLAGYVTLPEISLVSGRLIVAEPALMFPEVHLPIFVPPESSS